MTRLTAPDRRGTDSNKWRRYPADVLPLWVADMDFAADPRIAEAIRARLDHGVLGYGRATDEQREVLVRAMLRDHGWKIEPEWLVFLPGVEGGFNMALSAFTSPGGGVLEELPVYAPLRAAPGHWGLTLNAIWQRPETGRWTSDATELEAAARASDALLLCNPQNPTGRVYTRAELEFRAELCLRHDMVLISDEIHCGLVLDGRHHIPAASLSPEIAARSVTLMAASKTWNVPGLKTAFAIIPDAAMRTRFEASKRGMVDSVNVLGLAGMSAAYALCTDWRDAARARLAANRDLLAARLPELFPGAAMLPAEAGFLAWIDFRALKLPVPAAEFFLDRARVALSGGTDFGSGLEGWARLNYGCTPEVLEEALQRMARALRDRGAEKTEQA
ncbi:PatB family C-S lyase [Yangia mangrovi]|uniref:cysteine-S-conjugate beta-lyase n=1 Tax=Alloyangia mangrovi TaxID=1779329 RepID=A0A2A3JP93_9RHOB|nr:PatB family C-S lyase [Alloyangia mangrovi]MCT4372739.1 PatB family C-S lyase [Alloyangia mangrovi]